jgi:FkbM family methyltransferase
MNIMPIACQRQRSLAHTRADAAHSSPRPLMRQQRDPHANIIGHSTREPIRFSAMTIACENSCAAATAPAKSKRCGCGSKDELAALRQDLWDQPPGAIIGFRNLQLRITDGPNAYMQLKDVFFRGIYRFASSRPDPLIIDGGSNMGISVMGFKHDHPGSRIIAFEPDLQIANLLQENIERNLRRDAGADVSLIAAGLGAVEGTASFDADGSAGGRLSDEQSSGRVKVVRLSDYLTEPVDFLKLNIEGEELPVLQECAASGALAHVREMVVEYHGWPGAVQCLGELLNLLDQEGFRYLVHDFDSETCTTSKPPFKLRPAAPWFCLVHAKRA